MKVIKIGEYECNLVESPKGGDSGTLVYMIYPGIEPIPADWLEDKAAKYGCGIAVVYVPASFWNDSLTPWSEPGETSDAQPFGGKAPEFKKELIEKIVPSIEKNCNADIKRRNLIGVSLSGLFTLWEWLQDSAFFSIASLSGSFWYEGFMDWFDNQNIPPKPGKAYFLLGTKEPDSRIKAFRSVGENTQKIVERLTELGINTEFQWVPGDHFYDPLGRASKAFENLFEK